MISFYEMDSGAVWVDPAADAAMTEPGMYAERTDQAAWHTSQPALRLMTVAEAVELERQQMGLSFKAR